MSRNPRYVAYAKEHGHSPDEQLQQDREIYPGGRMTGFLLWIAEKKQAFFLAHPEAFFRGWNGKPDPNWVFDQEAWDRFLGVER